MLQFVLKLKHSFLVSFKVFIVLVFKRCTFLSCESKLNAAECIVPRNTQVFAYWPSKARVETYLIIFVADTVQCDAEKMTIYILKNKISIPEGDLSQYNISWNDPDCGPSEKSNDTYLILVAGYSSCGTEAVNDGDYVLFRNKVNCIF